MNWSDFKTRGRGDCTPLKGHDDIVKMKGCPDCNGRGYFLINPFATGGTNGCGGIGNCCQCQTCLNAKAYWDKHGHLPPELVAEMQAKARKDEETARKAYAASPLSDGHRKRWEDAKEYLDSLATTP